MKNSILNSKPLVRSVRTSSLLLLAGAISLAGTRTAHAQETIVGRTFLSLGGGLSLGPGTLWSIRRQPLRNPNLRPLPGQPDFVDSLFVSQAVDAGSSFLVSVTRYPSTRIGLGADLAFNGFRSSQDCTVAYDAAEDRLAPDDPATVSSPNRSACEDVRSRKKDAITLDVMPFVAWRLTPDNDITPVVKVGGGFSLSPCTVRVNSPLRDLVNGECTGGTRPVVGGSIGFYRQTELETQFHFEFKWSIHRWGVIDGMADLDGVGQSASAWRGSFGFSMGVDFQV